MSLFWSKKFIHSHMIFQMQMYSKCIWDSSLMMTGMLNTEWVDWVTCPSFRLGFISSTTSSDTISFPILWSMSGYVGGLFHFITSQTSLMACDFLIDIGKYVYVQPLYQRQSNCKSWDKGPLPVKSTYFRKNPAWPSGICFILAVTHVHKPVARVHKVGLGSFVCEIFRF